VEAKAYRHSAGLTSQVFFCGMPLRIDTYNQCQFDCAYCFAKMRGGHRGSARFSAASVEAIESRLERVSKGQIKSALDEFIARRIPFQLGGMVDPFTAAEDKYQVTRALLSVLAEHDYPTVISTKNPRAFNAQTISQLQNGNFYVRFSISMLDLKVRSLFEETTGTPAQILKACIKLKDKGISSSIRFQPIFPGYENEYFKFIPKLVSAGVEHVSLEYLKLSVDAPETDFKRLSLVYPSGIHQKFKSLGAKRLGREFVLPASQKVKFFRDFKRDAFNAGISVGLADNEFLHLSDGGACCGGANLFLRNANFFDANIQSVLRGKIVGDVISFSDLKGRWMPKLNVGTYLNSNSRMKGVNGQWLAYLKRDWNGDSGTYGPSFFYGIAETGKSDRAGFKKYVVADHF